MDSQTISSAAGNGHLDLIKWAIENGCKFDSYACRSTIMHNHLDVLKWLRANGCAWNDKFCTIAVEYNNLDTLKWAIDNGCKYGDKTYQVANRNAMSGKNKYKMKVDDAMRILEYLDSIGDKKIDF